MVLATSLSIPPAHARENALVIRSPEPDAVQTVVTGHGPAASVAMPDGPASMTPRWLVARAEWIQKQPVIEDAGLSKGSGLWYRFSDEQTGIVHCH
ncbi:hypothetical protein BON30_03865 [Cystobacter ferrugineus]|uniref:Uncharacterized protein n=2 Tax=Cystobacter ferrugineus TaxID=83449 RepID=A0A1L9BJA3_9BACT|nr:hypothetical protein BON30_03865 [Cystobacter ferrugineus]